MVEAALAMEILIMKLPHWQSCLQKGNARLDGNAIPDDRDSEELTVGSWSSLSSTNASIS